MADQSTPRVAVVITAHNAEAFLAETLESVLSQGYGDWAAVVADDASTDGTLAIARSFAKRDPRVATLALRQNLGVVGARNAAVGASPNSELIALLDHDDRWRPDYLERCLALYDDALAEGRRVGIVASNAFFLYPEGVSNETVADRFGWVEPIDYDSMLEQNYVFARAVFSRLAFQTAGGFAEETAGTDDYDLWLRMMEAGYEVASTREPLTYYRYHAAGLSWRRVAMSSATISVWRRALERGHLTRAQRRRVRARIRHYRALRERARVYEALAAGRYLGAARFALAAAPLGLVAFLQEPRRWREWLAEMRPSGARAAKPR